jgi:methylenetetrahydrofolate reductase (NADPH)
MHLTPPEKAYLEFFCPPQHVEELLEILNDNPSITYHAVNKQGDFRSNTAPGPNAVTWGVFPGAEVIQPTVVDSAAFQAWKDEAYELGSQWAQLYQETSPETQKLIHSVFDEYHLGELVAVLPFSCDSPRRPPTYPTLPPRS